MVIADERQVVELAARGDDEAFEELYRDNAHLVFNLALRSTRNRDDAEDISQDVWLKVHGRLPRLREPDAFGGWLRRIVHNACIDHARVRKPCPDLWENIEARDAAPDDVVVDAEERNLVWEAMGSLSPRQSTALFLREVEGYEYRRIAETIETSVSGVETLLFRARHSLARMYGVVATSRTERCRLAQQVMAAVVDGEGGPVEKRSLYAHLDTCSHCRDEVRSLRQASGAYAALPLLAAPYVFPTAKALLTVSLGAKVGLLVAKIKALLLPAALATSLTAASVAGVATVTPGPSWQDSVQTGEAGYTASGAASVQIGASSSSAMEPLLDVTVTGASSAGALVSQPEVPAPADGTELAGSEIADGSEEAADQQPASSPAETATWAPVPAAAPAAQGVLPAVGIPAVAPVLERVVDVVQSLVPPVVALPAVPEVSLPPVVEIALSALPAAVGDVVSIPAADVSVPATAAGAVPPVSGAVENTVSSAVPAATGVVAGTAGILGGLPARSGDSPPAGAAPAAPPAPSGPSLR